VSSGPATVAIPGYLAGTWKGRPVLPEIAFSVRRLMVSNTRCRFTSYDVAIITSEEPLGAPVAATIDLAPIGTGNEPRDSQLGFAGYFDVEKCPAMSWRSASIHKADDGWVIDAELTLHAVTRQVPLAVEVNGSGPDQFGGQRAGFSATEQISRRDFGTSLAIPMDGRGLAVGDKVPISLEIEAVQK